MSIWPRRRPALPAYARAWLSPEERVLTFASTSGGDLVVATPRGLWITDRRQAPAATSDDADGVSAAEHPAGTLLSWEFIVTAKWSGNSLSVVSAEQAAPQIMRRLPARTLALPEPADLPRVVRQRIERSVAASHRRPLRSGGSVLLVGRRVSGSNGLLWYAVFDREADVDDQHAREEAALMLESAAASTAGPEAD